LGQSRCIPDIHYDSIVEVCYSTGGLIAIAIGTQNWSLKDCIKAFKLFGRAGLVERTSIGTPILETISIARHGSIYKTKPMYKALRDTFGVRSLFGGSREDGALLPTKVAVFASHQEGQRGVVIANYNRRDTPTSSRSETGAYSFFRPGNPSQEVQLWEAAAACDATPPYHKPFLHQASGRKFFDGGYLSSNPAQILYKESKLIWQETTDRQPDIFLSIGTGQYKLDAASQNEMIKTGDIPQR
jgi:predicted acylesterase/phospholipase RssA